MTASIFARLLVVFAVAALAVGVASAETVVLDFEDLTGLYEPIPDGYGGIAHWTDWTTSDLVDDNYQPHSGVRWCYCFGNGTPIEFGTEYIFDGSWISGPEGPPTDVVWYDLYLEGDLVHTSEGVHPVPEPTWNPSGYSGPVDEVRITHTFTNLFCMDDFTYTTLTVVDTVTADLSCVPDSGVLPLNVHVEVTLTNEYTGFARRIRANLDFLTAGGFYISHFKAGTKDLGPGDSFTAGFNQILPVHPHVLGTNTIMLYAEDITPSPFNQPPYPPSGDTDTGTCTVTGIAP